MNSEELPAKLEFEVPDLDFKQYDSLRSSLAQEKGVKNVEVKQEDSRVLVTTVLPTSLVHQLIESSVGKSVVLKGMGSGVANTNLDAAVCEISNDENLANLDIKGVIRFVQLDQEHCAIDGVVDGLAPGPHALNICEFGNLSNGCKSTGNHFNPHNKPHGLPTDKERHAGDLGNIEADQNGRATFRIIDQQIKIWDIVGRSVCISEQPDLRDNDLGAKIACGIVARSARIFDNVKKICACSGRTLWDERDLKRSGNSKI